MGITLLRTINPINFMRIWLPHGFTWFSMEFLDCYMDFHGWRRNYNGLSVTRHKLFLLSRISSLVMFLPNSPVAQLRVGDSNHYAKPCYKNSIAEVIPHMKNETFCAEHADQKASTMTARQPSHRVNRIATHAVQLSNGDIRPEATLQMHKILQNQHNRFLCNSKYAMGPHSKGSEKPAYVYAKFVFVQLSVYHMLRSTVLRQRKRDAFKKKHPRFKLFKTSYLKYTNLVCLTVANPYLGVLSFGSKLCTVSSTNY